MGGGGVFQQGVDAIAFGIGELDDSLFACDRARPTPLSRAKEVAAFDHTIESSRLAHQGQRQLGIRGLLPKPSLTGWPLILASTKILVSPGARPSPSSQRTRAAKRGRTTARPFFFTLLVFLRVDAAANPILCQESPLLSLVSSVGQRFWSKSISSSAV